MAKKVRPEDLTEQQLRRLLISKRRQSRRKRLDDFRRSGRLVDIAPNVGTSQTENYSQINLDEVTFGATPPVEPTEVEKKKEERRAFADRALWVVEIAAIAGLLFILLNGVGIVRDLNAQVAAALVQPTLSPTPLITLAILPSGHKPPTDPGGARPNFDEIPAHLRDIIDQDKLLDSFYNVPIPTPSPEQAVRIQVPKINVDAPIVQGDGWEQLKQGVGQHLGSGDPGKAGNLVLSAHNDIFGEIFRHLDQLENGDEIIVHTNIQSYTYVIDIETQVVEPTEVDVMEHTDTPSLTLISCYPYLINDKRIIVKASLVTP